MRLFLRSSCALVLIFAGCGQPVRQDRTITFAPDGDKVGFQHEADGVFVADKNGGGLKKIFEPGKDVLATSTPLWSPDGKRLLFTTARSVNGAQPPIFGPRPEQNPAGNVHLQQPVIYTCWLRDEAKDDKPVPLFEERCDHVGYVAANLAVRWHPDGNRVLFVKQIDNGFHGIFEFDLTTKAVKRVLPGGANAVVFDWSPDNKYLTCVLGSANPHADDGIWLGDMQAGQWWHVPESRTLGKGELQSLIEQLRATKPAWTRDGKHFAFVSYTPHPDPNKPGKYSLRRGSIERRTTELLSEGEEPLRDLHWSPDGERLGFVKGGEKPTLHTHRDGKVSEPINAHGVRKFAGWSHDGKALAYVGPGKIPNLEEETWAGLFLPDPLASDSVFIAAGKEAEREVFTGMRVTFPNWSPTEEKLSLWFTFTPTYRSPLSTLLEQWIRFGVRPGDPAAVFDTKTGTIGWMTVNPHEKFQVGHYYLLAHDYAKAWKWYEEAEKEMPPAGPNKATSMVDYIERITAPRDPGVFEYVCLLKLDRQKDALARLERFRASIQPELPTDDQEPWLAIKVNNLSARDVVTRCADPKGLPGVAVRDLYLAQVFLCVDALDVGERFFTEELARAETDESRFSKAVVLSQFLLLQKKHTAYAGLALDTIAPLAGKLFRPLPQGNQWAAQDWVDMLHDAVLLGGGFSALFPLGAPDFLALLPDAQVRRAFEQWKALRPKASDDTIGPMLDYAMLSAADRLGWEKEVKEVSARIKDLAPNWKAEWKERLRQARQRLAAGNWGSQ